MPYTLHPSGFLSWHADSSAKNLLFGRPCPECNRVAGHQYTCSLFKPENKKASSSRGKLFDCVSILWASYAQKSFITFTLPSQAGKNIFQDSAHCTTTGDLAVSKAFSKTLEAWKVKEKRAGNFLSYVWIAEAQTKRQEKFGGIADIHFHLVCNRKLKHNNGRFADLKTFDWLQSNWCKQVGVYANNCVHVDPIPDGANSIPAYLSKYMGKGEQRPIFARKFQATQDLSAYVPVKLNHVPDDLTLIRETTYTTPTGFEVCQRYFNTRETLELYGHHFQEQKQWNVSRTGRKFTQEAINARMIDRILRQQYPDHFAMGLS